MRSQNQIGVPLEIVLGIMLALVAAFSVIGIAVGKELATAETTTAEGACSELAGRLQAIDATTERLQQECLPALLSAQRTLEIVAEQCGLPIAELDEDTGDGYSE